MSGGRTTQQPQLADRIRKAAASGEVVQDQLQTDQRVLARITDGIYRQPASALRELIANAYDADATDVVITTDAPRFDRMIIRDNGSGMSIDTFAHVFHHIGGSLKRTHEGSTMDVASSSDPGLSPGGRKLIGKIGIGLFSVAQLTPHFQVITKTRGEKVRRIADIILAPEDAEKALADASRGENPELKTGSLRIWTVPASDADSQGTEIVLMDLRPQTKDLLRSRARWLALQSQEQGADEELIGKAIRPAYHIGGLDFTSTSLIELPKCLPWGDSDKPDVKFAKLVEAVEQQTAEYQNPELDHVLDYYLKLIWTLALGIPGSYIDGHPFDLDAESGLEFFSLANEPKGQAQELLPSGKTKIRALLKLAAPKDFEDPRFGVMVDGVRLKRPLKFRRKGTPTLSKNLMFLGKCAPNLSAIPESFRGGPLRFEAYLSWSPKVVPKDHNGVLIRIKGASGTLFDPTFMGYQVSEQTRLKQISAEIFILEGLESALNIDRESFNYASTHFQYITRWLHGAIRQLTNRHKTISGKARTQKQQQAGQKLEAYLQKTSDEAWTAVRGSDSEPPPDIGFEDDNAVISKRRESGAPTFSRNEVITRTQRPKSKKPDLEPRLKAIAVVLQAYGVFDSMSYSKQERLLSEIGKIISAEASDAE
jgi:hypothetical protein